MINPENLMSVHLGPKQRGGPNRPPLHFEVSLQACQERVKTKTGFDCTKYTKVYSVGRGQMIKTNIQKDSCKNSCIVHVNVDSKPHSNDYVC